MGEPADLPAAPTGLTEAQARERLAAEGPNALPDPERHGLAAIVLGVLREPMFLLLVGAAAVYLLLGDLREALVLAASVAVVLAITIVQERRTERALDALRDLSSPRALVVRDGREKRIAGRDVVRGDLLLLREGDRVAADACVLAGHDLLVDESLLTGESVPVEKRAGGAAPEHARVYSGTLVVRGAAHAEVSATGAHSELGRIGVSLAQVDRGKTALETETARIVRRIAVFGLGVCVLVAILYVVTRGDPLAGVLAGLTLAMAVLPEEFPLVLTVFFALGAWRISRQGVLTRRMPAIEMLGAATVLCCDKTGTLTENRMTVAETWAAGAWRKPDARGAAEAALLDAAALACERAPFDPMERAILDTQSSLPPGEAQSSLPPGGGPGRGSSASLPPSPERTYPLAEDFLAVAHAWRMNGEAFIAMKGAPETVLALCAMDEGERRAALEEASRAARRGLRLLAVARAPWDARPWPERLAEAPFRFLGFVALADPLRRTVPGAVALARRAGIRVVMITGDHSETALAIAREAGLRAEGAMTGRELASGDDAALAAAVRRVDVFARVRPEQKLRLVRALRDAGEVVAMTGDGVNDAPALKAAHIGIAMGQRGTDVAREAASLVLLEDDFTTIVSTVRLGRRIYDNIRNAMRYLLAVHVPLAGMTFLPLVFGWPLFAFPVHVVFLEFVIDPACSIAFEAERSDVHVMDRPPRPPAQRLFTLRMLAYGLGLGATLLAASALVYGWALTTGRGEDGARALAFATLVAGNLALILVNRSSTLTAWESLAHPNRALWWIVAGAAAALAASIYVPPVASLFRFAAPAPADALLALAAGAASVLWFDFVKLARRAR